MIQRGPGVARLEKGIAAKVNRDIRNTTDNMCLSGEHVTLSPGVPRRGPLETEWSCVEFGPIDGPDGALAQTALTVTVRTLAVQRVVVRFDVEENCVLRPPTCRANGASGIAIQAISTHEFGHALVTLGHVSWGDGRWLTMNPVYWGSERPLARGDKLGIRARYNATRDAVEEPTPSSGGGSEIIVEFFAPWPPVSKRRLPQRRRRCHRERVLRSSPKETITRRGECVARIQAAFAGDAAAFAPSAAMAVPAVLGSRQPSPSGDFPGPHGMTGRDDAMRLLRRWPGRALNPRTSASRRIRISSMSHLPLIRGGREVPRKMLTSRARCSDCSGTRCPDRTWPSLCGVGRSSVRNSPARDPYRPLRRS